MNSPHCHVSCELSLLMLRPLHESFAIRRLCNVPVHTPHKGAAVCFLLISQTETLADAYQDLLQVQHLVYRSLTCETMCKFDKLMGACLPTSSWKQTPQKRPMFFYWGHACECSNHSVLLTDPIGPLIEDFLVSPWLKLPDCSKANACACRRRKAPETKQW